MNILYICISIFVTYLGVQESPCPVGYHYTEKNGHCYQSVVCPKETVIDLQECMESTGRPVCVCNRKDWFYGQDPFRCNLANSSLKLSAMEEGVELTQDGTVRTCPPGYFKSQYGGSICSPHSKCPQGFTVDIKGTAVQDTICKRSLSSSVPTTPATSSSTKADTNSTAVKIDIWIGLLIAAVVMIVSIIAFACWLKRRQASASKKEKKENPLPPPRQVITTQGQDYRGRTEGSLPGSEDIDFSEQNEQTSLKPIQNSSFENSSSNIGRNRPVASVLPSVRQSSQEEQETGQVIASPVQEDGVRLALGVNTIQIPFNYRAQSDSGIADDEESPTGSNVMERYLNEH